VSAIDDLRNLPLSSLFAGPLVAAIDASLQAQTEQVELLLDAGYADGELVTVSFGYTTSEVDPETGRVGRVAKSLEVPLLLFLTIPNLLVSEIEETFSAKLTEVESAPTQRVLGRPLQPLRLRVAPAGRSVTRNRTTRSNFDLEIRMVARLDQESAGMDVLERAANTAIAERVTDRATQQLDAKAAARRQPTDATEAGAEGPNGA